MSKDVEGAKPVQNPAAEAEIDQDQLVEASLQQFIDSATTPEPEPAAVKASEIVSDHPVANAPMEISQGAASGAVVTHLSEAKISAIQPVHVVSGPVSAPPAVVRSASPMLMLVSLLVAFLLGAGTVYYIVRSLVMDQKALAGATPPVVQAAPAAAPAQPATADPVPPTTPTGPTDPSAVAPQAVAVPGVSGPGSPPPSLPGAAPGAPGTPPAVTAPTTGTVPKPPAAVAPVGTVPAAPPADEPPAKTTPKPVPSTEGSAASGSSKPSSGRHHPSSAGKASGSQPKTGAATAAKPQAAAPEKPAPKKPEPAPKSTGEKPDWVDPFAQ